MKVPPVLVCQADQQGIIADRPFCGIEFISEIKLNRPDNGVIPQTGACGVPQIAQIRAKGIPGQYTGIQKRNPAQIFINRKPEFKVRHK